MENIYKIGDRVYDGIWDKWGTVTQIIGVHVYPVKVQFDLEDSVHGYTEFGCYSSSDKWPRLSFTEYNFINGGFSQKRPLPNIKKDTLVYVRNRETFEWQMRYFSHFDNQRIFCFDYQRKSTENFTSISSWEYYSIENPLLKEE